MDFIHGLLMEDDDLDEKENENEVTPILGTSTVSGSDNGTPDPALPDNASVPWCKCGACQIMPQEVENKY